MLAVALGVVGLVLAAPLADAAAPAPPHFGEVTAAVGVSEVTEAYGLGVADWDGDGCDDLYVGRHLKARGDPAGFAVPRLYRNTCRGRFVDEVWRLHLDRLDPSVTADRHSPAFADYDGDGRLDLFIGAGGDQGGLIGPGHDDQLFHQTGAGDFIDVAAAAGVTARPQSDRGVTWLDYDRDGRLDLVVGNYLEPDRPNSALQAELLWHQESGGTFTNAAAAAHLGALETAFSLAAADVDGDGFDDVIAAPGRGVSVYYGSADGTFTMRSLGVTGANSVAVGDYDNDGRADLFVSRGQGDVGQPPDPALEAVLLRQSAARTFVDVTASTGVGFTRCAGAIFVDANDDGRLDLVVARGPDAARQRAHDLLLVNGGRRFQDRALDAGLRTPARGSPVGEDTVAWGDLDNDRHVDLIFAHSWGRPSAVQVYRNAGGPNGSIRLSLDDPTSANRRGLGAKVWVTTGDGTQYRQVQATSALKSQSAGYLLVGTGRNARITRLRVRWPDGSEQIGRNLAVNATYVASKGDSIRRQS